MKQVKSADGTTIAYDSGGSGPAIVFAVGAFNLHDTCAPIAELLSDRFTTVVYDRRGRGESGDTSPYAIEREVEDLAAVIDAVGGRAAVFGFSSGAVLALAAASAGVPIDHLFLYEAPFRFHNEAPAPPADFPAQLQELIDDGRAGDAVSLFQLDGVGLPPAVVDGIRRAPFFPQLEAMAQSTVYDATITGSHRTPSAAMLAVTTPTTVMRGEQTWPLLATAAAELVTALPHATLQIVKGAADHGIDPEATAATIRAALQPDS